MCSDVAIRVSNVSKTYKVNNEEDQLNKGWKRFFHIRSKAEHIQALKDVSFDVYHGETLGIVGHNGAGKSTLLRIVSGITEPDSGSVEVNGVIAPVLALQGGFNPQRTGRDNVYLKGAVMGLSRVEIDERLESIAAFADIGEFMEQPLRTYSNGMKARLAFAVAFNMEPDILIIDETLTVGDEIFRRKCMDRITTIKESGATILFVTHGYNLILQLCDRALLLDQSERLLLGDPKTVVERLHELVYAPLDNKTFIREEIKKQDKNGELTRRTIQPRKVTSGSDCSCEEDLEDKSLVTRTRRELVQQGAIIGEVRVFNNKGEVVNVLRSSGKFRISFPVWFTQPATRVRASLSLKTVEGLIVAEDSMVFYADDSNDIIRPKKQIKARFNFHNLLVDGVYTLDVLVIGELAGKDVVLHGILDATSLRIETGRTGNNRGLVQLIDPVQENRSSDESPSTEKASLLKY